jgi:hypothetical protein
VLEERPVPRVYADGAVVVQTLETDPRERAGDEHERAHLVFVLHRQREGNRGAHVRADEVVSSNGLGINDRLDISGTVFLS